jgi:hypothetical protein
MPAPTIRLCLTPWPFIQLKCTISASSLSSVRCEQKQDVKACIERISDFERIIKNVSFYANSESLSIPTHLEVAVMADMFMAPLGNTRRLSITVRTYIIVLEKNKAKKVRWGVEEYKISESGQRTESE